LAASFIKRYFWRKIDKDRSFKGAKIETLKDNIKAILFASDRKKHCQKI